MCTLQRTRESWQTVFFITAGVYALGAIIYLVLASGTVQPWATDKSKSTVELDVVDEQKDSVDGQAQAECIETQVTRL